MLLRDVMWLVVLPLSSMHIQILHFYAVKVKIFIPYLYFETVTPLSDTYFFSPERARSSEA